MYLNYGSPIRFILFVLIDCSRPRTYQKPAGGTPFSFFRVNLFRLVVKAARKCYNIAMNVRVKAYAKLNLTLAVTGWEKGYHTLDSLVCTVDLYDLIKLKKRRDGLVTVEMHGRGSENIPFEKNNAARAAEAYIKRFSTGGADIVIYKNIPVGAGLGGSSADIAGVVKGMARLYGRGSDKELKELADELGSDSGYMLTGGFARLTGRGDEVARLDIKTRLNFLLLLPREGVSTAECYKFYDESHAEKLSSEFALSSLLSGDIAGLGQNLNNALLTPAKKLNGGIEEAVKELSAFAPSGVNMTGSGSGVYALFDSAEMCAYAKSRYRGKCTAIQLKSYIPKK